MDNGPTTFCGVSITSSVLINVQPAVSSMTRVPSSAVARGERGVLAAASWLPKTPAIQRRVPAILFLDGEREREKEREKERPYVVGG
jgi:hypothetical protein